MDQGCVAVAFSGGVDSAVAAYLLQQQGYEVMALSMLLAKDKVDEAAVIADKLGIKHHVIDLRAQFKELIIKPFLNEYAQARTPNPCCWCNRQFKFTLLWQEACKLGAKWLATGHYARISQKQNTYHLLRALDAKKDQSYFLFALEQEDLAHTIFPLGELTKTEVKKKAEELGLNISSRESQDVCFIKGPLREYLKANLSLHDGPILDQNGQYLGQHDGLPLYTLGQRQGLGIPASSRLYVKELNINENSLVLAPLEELQTRKVYIRNIKWTSGYPPIEINQLQAQIRYGAQAQPVSLFFLDDGVCCVEFKKSVFAPTCGQYIVFYKEDEVLGGGEISKLKR